MAMASFSPRALCAWLWCTDDNWHSENGYRILRVGCIGGDTCQAEVSGQSQTADDRVPHTWVNT